MKTIILIGLIILTVKVNAQTICEGKTVVPVTTFNQCDNNPWVLVFEDNFEGNNLDLSTWELQPWGEGALYGNNGASQEYNTLNNIEVSNGTLKIVTKKETIIRRAISWKPDNEILEDGLPNLRTYKYTSSNIWTKNIFTYGKFEARIKIPKGKGFWPAYWTFSGNPWNEIDVFEFWNENNIQNNYDPSKLSKVHHMTAHYDYDNDGNTNMCGTKYTGTDFSQDFHIFTLVWEGNKIEWYVDGQLKRTDYKYYTMLGQSTGCTINAWTQYIMNKIYPKDPMAIILNLAIQHGYDVYGNNKSPDNSTPFPSQMEVDWVKYYSKHPYQNIYISGPSIVCASNSSTFTLNNVPPNSTIFWTKSSNIMQLSGNTGTNYTVKASSSSSSSSGWVKASVDGTIFTKTIWVGKPNYILEGDEIVGVFEPGIANLVYEQNQAITNVNWTRNGAIATVSGGLIVGHFRAGSQSGFGTVYANATNCCGSTEEMLLVEVTGGWHKVYPNPAKDILVIEIERDKINEVIRTQEIEILLYDKLMVLQKHIKSKGSKFTIKINDLKPDLYILHLKIGDKVYKEKITISRY